MRRFVDHTIFPPTFAVIFSPSQEMRATVADCVDAAGYIPLLISDAEEAARVISAADPARVAIALIDLGQGRPEDLVALGDFQSPLAPLPPIPVLILYSLMLPPGVRHWGALHAVMQYPYQLDDFLAALHALTTLALVC